MPTVKLTTPFCKSAVAADGAGKTVYWHQDMPGFGLAVTTDGHRSFVVQYRTPEGVSRRYTIPGGPIKLKDAEKAARAIMGRVALGIDPVVQRRAERMARKAAVRDSFDKVAERYMRTGAVDKAGNKLRTAGEYQRIIDKYLLPKFKGRAIASIRRGEIGRHLDHIATAHGPVMADHVLKVLGRIMRWHAARDDDFSLPLVAGMRRTSIRDRARKRILSDGEIRALWTVCERLGTPYSFMVRLILLTGVRLREAANASRSEFNGDGEWTIPAARHKSKEDFLVPLSSRAAEVFTKVPEIGTKGWLFTHDGDVPINSFSDLKREFDEEMLAELRKVDPEAELPRWTTHDLRRSARSLMSRAGVPPQHAEVALGHVLPGIQQTYDRHSYSSEKLAAFEKLADLIGRILDPQSNVIPMPARRDGSAA